MKILFQSHAFKPLFCCHGNGKVMEAAQVKISDKFRLINSVNNIDIYCLYISYYKQNMF